VFPSRILEHSYYLASVIDAEGRGKCSAGEID
jgi:hypothetical protein